MKQLKNDDFFDKRDIQFLKFCNDSNDIFRIKNRQYNDAISRTGLLGASVEIIGVAARLEPLIVNNKDFDTQILDLPSFRESVMNALHDLHNYSNIALIMLEDGNWRGE